MPLTKEQLLIPRVLCIGTKEGEPNYPNSPVNTGDVLELTIHGYVFQACYGVIFTRDTVSKFPHLFKPLHWWYGRTVEEMPKFAKYIKTGAVIDISDWYVSHLGCIAMRDDENNEVYPDSWDYEPADLSDYQEYQKQ